MNANLQASTLILALVTTLSSGCANLTEAVKASHEAGSRLVYGEVTHIFPASKAPSKVCSPEVGGDEFSAACKHYPVYIEGVLYSGAFTKGVGYFASVAGENSGVKEGDIVAVRTMKLGYGNGEAGKFDHVANAECKRIGTIYTGTGVVCTGPHDIYDYRKDPAFLAR